jgi:hypothetical protein
VARAQGEYAEAQYLFRESFAMFREIGDRLSMARSLVNLADTTAMVGDQQDAWRCFREAWRMATDAQLAPLALDALAGMADLLAQEGASRTALDLTAQIAAHPAATRAARERVARLRAELEPAPSPGERAVAHTDAPERPFAEIVEAIVKGERVD